MINKNATIDIANSSCYAHVVNRMLDVSGGGSDSPDLEDKPWITKIGPVRSSIMTC